LLLESNLSTLPSSDPFIIMSTLNPMYCRAFLSEEGCSFGRSCSLRHDIFKCSCGRVLLLAYRTPHTRGKNHQKQLAGLNGATVPQDRTPPPGPSRVNGNGYSHTNNGGYFQPGLESVRMFFFVGDFFLCLFFLHFLRFLNSLRMQSQMYSSWSVNIVERSSRAPLTMLMSRIT